MWQPLERIAMEALDAVPANILPDLRLRGTLPTIEGTWIVRLLLASDAEKP